jgi:DNA (cytosine-5)-methyltransferase 1
MAAVRISPRPRVIDLFCGAGGLSEGFRQAGFDVRLGVDIDTSACESYAFNLRPAKALRLDLTDPLATGDQLRRAASVNRVEVLLGGPSCQGFSTHGRRNGWVRRDDHRNSLYIQYLRLLAELRPDWFVMENVPGLAYYEGGRFLRRIVRRFASLGYKAEASLVLAADFGVPQLRKRLLILGTRTNKPVPVLRRSHAGPLRRDQTETWRAKGEDHLLPPHVTVWEAIGDLPHLEAGEGNPISRYMGNAFSPYQRDLRSGSNWLRGHEAPPLAEVHRRLIEYVKEGGTWRDIPRALLPKRFAHIPRSDYTNLFARLDRKRPAYTVTTQFNNVSTGCYTHPTSDRALTHREAARLQSFRDAYQFFGSKEACLRLIGNAVPPKLGYAVATAIRQAMMQTDEMEVLSA